MKTIPDLTASYEDYLIHERGLAALSVVAYLSDLRGLADFFPTRPVNQITTSDLRAYMRALSRQGFKAATIRRKFHGFGTFWRWLKMENQVDSVATEFLRLPRKPQQVIQWLNAHDLRVFVETPVDRTDPDEKQRDRLAWLLLAWLGLRRSEVLGLDVGDVRLVDDMIIIRAGKGKKDRVLPLPPEIKNDLDQFIQGRTSGFLFLGRDGSRWKVKAFNRAFARHLRACGLDDQGITPHTLRHTFATHLVAAGVPITTVSKLLGHADIQSTMTYVHIDMSTLRTAIAQHILVKLSTLI